MPASRAATEMIRTLARRRLLDRDVISSYVPRQTWVLTGSGAPCPRATRAGRRGRLGELAPAPPGPRPSASVGHHDVDGDEQVAEAVRRGGPRPCRAPAACGRSGVPGGTRRVTEPSSVGTRRSVPSTASAIGDRHGQRQVVAATRPNRSSARTLTSTYRSPAGPPRSPGSPRPPSRIRCPSATPAGMRTLIVRVLVTPPVPWHSGHFSSTTVPDALALAARLGEAERRPGCG